MIISGFEDLIVSEIVVEDEVFNHSSLTVKLLIDNKDLNAFLSKNKVGVSQILASEDANIIFSGTVGEIKCLSNFLNTEVTLKAYSFSYDLDKEKYKRVYQDKDNTYDKIMQFLVKDKNLLKILDSSFSNKNVGKIIFQNNETDFEFIKRLCKENGLYLYLDNQNKKTCNILIDNKASAKNYNLSRENIKLYKSEIYEKYEDLEISTEHIFDICSNLSIENSDYIVLKRKIVQKYEYFEVFYSLTTKKIEKEISNDFIILGLAKVINNVQEEDLGQIQVEFCEYENVLSSNKIYIDYVSPLTEKEGGLSFLPDENELVETVYRNEKCVALGCVRSTKLDEKIKDIKIRSLLTRKCKMTFDENEININVDKNNIKLTDKNIEITNDKFKMIMDENHYECGFENSKILLNENKAQILTKDSIDFESNNINEKSKSELKIDTKKASINASNNLDMQSNKVKVKTQSFDVG